jgi:hypothetical protein
MVPFLLIGINFSHEILDLLAMKSCKRPGQGAGGRISISAAAEFAGAQNPRAIGQDRLKDWIAHRIKAKKPSSRSKLANPGRTASTRNCAPMRRPTKRRFAAYTKPPGKPAFEGYESHGVPWLRVGLVWPCRRRQH